MLIDITKDAQQASCIFDWCAAAPAIPGWRHAHPIGHEQLAHAAALLNAAERPVILAGHGVLISGAMDALRRLAERAQIPVAVTLLGIGGFPASHPLNLGMMGMHGEAWVNTAIQEADLLLACGMRFDDRVTGNLKTYAPHAKKIHIDIDAAEINKNVRVDVGLVGDLRDVLERLLPAIAFNERTAWARAHRQRCAATPRSATFSSCPTMGTSTPRTSSTIYGERRAATTQPRSSSPTSASTRCGRRSPTTTRFLAR